MTVAITGASGLIGTALCRSLAADGVRVVRMVRREVRAPDEVTWDPQRGYTDVDQLVERDVTAVVNLAGAGIGDHRWTAAYKREILDSRVEGTDTIATAVAEMPGRPVLIAGSAMGYYGDTGQEIVDESRGPGEGFLADVVVKWEAAADPAREAGCRVAHARTGLIIAKGGGAFAPLVPIVKAGVSGKLGSGDQLWSFIAMTDEVRALRFLIDNDISGPVNLVAPAPVTNKEAIKTLAELYHRPSVLPVPYFAMRVAIGELAKDVMASTGVVPKVLSDHGFKWTFPGLEAALRAELMDERTSAAS